MAGPLGEIVNWRGAEPPVPRVLPGRTVRLEPIDAGRHFTSLAQAALAHPAIWDYMPVGPFQSEEDFRAWLAWADESPDHVFLVVIDQSTARAEGMASYMRAAPANGVLEIGYIWFGLKLQRTPAATEAIFLLLRHAFDDLGYRRVEWKCNDLNRASRLAAERFGFTYEGTFRQHMVVKGRNRDTAWYAMLDCDWPVIRKAFEAWLSPGNFDIAGKQHSSLSTQQPPIRPP